MIQLIDDNERFELQEGTSILYLRRIPVAVHAQITARNTVSQILPNGQPHEKVDATGVLLDSVDYAVVGWRNVPNPVTLQEAECTRENKRRLPVSIMEKVMKTVAQAESAAAGRIQEEFSSLESFLKARADYPALNCGQCMDDAEEGEGPPDCAACPIRGLVDEGKEATQVYDIICAPFFRVFPSLVPDALSLILPAMTKEKAAVFIMKLSLIHNFRAARLAQEMKANNGR